jgi:hypothetical protein
MSTAIALNLPPKLEVKEAHNMYGLFALDYFEINEVLFEMTGEVVHSPSRTSFQLAPGLHIENPIAGFINHHCKPSIRLEEGRFIANRKIYPGEEITANYNLSEDKVTHPFRCNCCGKLILGIHSTMSILSFLLVLLKTRWFKRKLDKP